VGTVGPCTDIDSLWLEVLDPTLGIGTQDPTGICQGDTVFLYASNNVGNSNFSWTPLDGIVSDPTEPGIFVAPQETTTYTASVEIEGCGASDEITIFVDTFDPGELTTTDTTICPARRSINGRRIFISMMPVSQEPQLCRKKASATP